MLPHRNLSSKTLDALKVEKSHLDLGEQVEQEVVPHLQDRWASSCALLRQERHVDGAEGAAGGEEGQQGQAHRQLGGRPGGCCWCWC